MSRTGLLIVLTLAAWTASAAELSNEELRKSCGEKTIVMGRDEDKRLVRAGETLGGFCSGYLLASFGAYGSNPECKKDVSPEFLLSVYEQYIKDKKVPNSASASNTLRQAFQRIASCK